VGGVALLVILALAGAFFIRRHKKKKLEEHFDGNFDPAYVENTSHAGNRNPRSMAGSGGGATLPRIDLLEGEDEAGMVEPYSAQPSLHQQYTGSSGKMLGAGAFAGAGPAMGASGASAAGMDPRQLHAYYNGAHSPPPPSTLSGYTHSTDPSHPLHPASPNAHQTMFPQPQQYPHHQPYPQPGNQAYNAYPGFNMPQQQHYPTSGSTEGSHPGSSAGVAGAATGTGIAAKRVSKEREAMGQYHTTNSSPQNVTPGSMANPHSAAGSPGADRGAPDGGYFTGPNTTRTQGDDVLVHQDAGRFDEEDDASGGRQKEIPPTYDSLDMNRRANRP
jgi:hypothetical protein